ncbi:MAG: type II secretion system F family protein [Gemmatimonadaceae bacterium]|nr:type II secretion system F family protein [Gemmatimonadaceae bacterium]
MNALLLIAVFIGALLLVIGGFAFANRRRLAAADAVRSRLGGDGGANSILRNELPISILRDSRVSDIPVLEQLLSGRGMAFWLEREIAQAGSKQRPGEVVLFALLFGLIGLTLGEWFGGALVAMLGLALGLPLPLAVLRVRQRRRKQRFTEQLPEALDLLINALKAGYSLQSAIEFAGRETAAPLGPELVRFHDESRLGIDIRTALIALQERVGTEDARMFVTSLLLQRETGGNLTELLYNISTLVRQRLAFQGQVETLTAEPKLSAYILTALPFFVFGAVTILSPDYMKPLLTTPAGQKMIAYAVISMLLGFFIMMRIADAEL